MTTGENGVGDKRIKKIIIAGGGSSGWMCASYLAKALNFQIDIKVIESSKIGRIGVGEATIPTIKEELFDFLEIPESEWMPHCNASFKLGIRYENWKTSLESGGDFYYHIFGEMPVCSGIPLSHLWLKKKLAGFNERLDQACFPASEISEQRKSPKYLNGQKAVHYAYHFDALEMADFLKTWCLNRGVTLFDGEIVKVELDEEGNIKELLTSDGETHAADLFIDCTGFAAVLIEKALGEPFNSFHESLLTDSAIAINIPESDDQKDIRPYTTATALNNGWMWQIPLYNRSGNGYAFASSFTTPEKATEEVLRFFGAKSDNIDYRVIKFRSGRRRNSWIKNCVSFGLASSFLEPLESTGLYFVYAALHQFVQYFPDKTFNPVLRKKFNERVAYMVEDVRDFIIMHFCTSPRTDTEYWIANKSALKIPDSLKEILELQKAGIPFKKSYHQNDSLYSVFEASFDRFWTNSNYQSVLAGVDYLPENIQPLLHYRQDIIELGEKKFAEIKFQTNKLIKELPGHYDYLKAQREKHSIEANTHTYSKKIFQK